MAPVETDKMVKSKTSVFRNEPRFSASIEVPFTNVSCLVAIFF